MPEAQCSDAKLDQQTALLKWILGGVGVALVGLAGFAATTFTSFMADRKQGEAFLREDVKTVLTKISEGNSDIARALQNQTQIMQQIRDDQRKFPAVAEAKP